MAKDSQNAERVIRQKRGVPIYRTNPSVPAKDEISRGRRVQLGNEHKGLIIDGGYALCPLLTRISYAPSEDLLLGGQARERMEGRG